MRGVTPNGVSAPCGAMIVTLSPTLQTQVLRELRADRDAPRGIKTVERALNHMSRDAGKALEIPPANAPHQRAG